LSRTFAFHQLDVFSSRPLLGNPLAVVHDADGLSDETMAAFARWTNLSETTFLLKPRDSGADYGVRIFTPGGELPFAGHPTLGSAFAWLTAGGAPRQDGVIVQECGVGLVRIRRSDSRLAFAAPPLRRTGPLDDATLDQITRGLRIRPDEIIGHQWIDNGPGWCAVMLASAEQALALRPDFPALGPLKLGVVAPQPSGADTDFEVRAFAASLGVGEDPVTGSLNAGLAAWLIGAGIAAPAYVAAQGAALGRCGRVFIEQVGADIWVGGDVTVCVAGSVSF
jgi:PhzF family phenazine biosynthesis protein